VGAITREQGKDANQALVETKRRKENGRGLLAQQEEGVGQRRENHDQASVDGRGARIRSGVGIDRSKHLQHIRDRLPKEGPGPLS